MIQVKSRRLQQLVKKMTADPDDSSDDDAAEFQLVEVAGDVVEIQLNTFGNLLLYNDLTHL